MNCSYIFVTLSLIFKGKEVEEDLIEVERQKPKSEREQVRNKVSITSLKEFEPKKVVLKKPFVEMKRNIRPLYVRAHLYGRSMSKVLTNSRSTVNIMPLRLLKALEKNISDLIGIKVAVFAFIKEVSKILGILLIDININNKTSLSIFFLIGFIASYNVLLGRDWIHANWCVSSSLHHV